MHYQPPQLFQLPHFLKIFRFILTLFIFFSLFVFVIAKNSNATDTHTHHNSHISEDKALNIITTILPIKAMVEEVGGQWVRVDVLLSPNTSPHHTRLKLRDAQRIKDSDALVMVSSQFEGFLKRFIKSNPKIKVLDFENLITLHLRNPHFHHSSEKHHHEEEHDDKHHHDKSHTIHHDKDSGYHHDHGETDTHKKQSQTTQTLKLKDYHFWLDTNVTAMASEKIAQFLSSLMPDKAEYFYQNHHKFVAQLEELTHSLLTQKDGLLHFAGIVAFHDGYQYFEKLFGVEVSGFILNGHNSQITPKNLATFKAQIKSGEVHCLWVENEFLPLAQSLEQSFEGNEDFKKIKILEVSPLGRANTHHLKGFHWFEALLTGLFDSYQSCALRTMMTNS